MGRGTRGGLPPVLPLRGLGPRLRGRLDAAVRDVMARDCQFVDAWMPLEQAFAIMQQSRCTMLPVVHGGDLVGVLTADNIEEWLMVRSALQRQPGPDTTAHSPLADSLSA